MSDSASTQLSGRSPIYLSTKSAPFVERGADKMRFLGASYLGAVGVVCRSTDGLYLGASSLIMEGIINSSVLESMACREILALVQDLNLRKITVAFDCLAVVQDLSRPFAGTNSAVLHEINDTSTLFERVSFRHENRVSNSETYRLARSATASNMGRQVWLLEPPDGLCINNSVMSE
ncbi:hypothetical protein ACQ4PT_070897 [Festuca glaucescens]